MKTEIDKSDYDKYKQLFTDTKVQIECDDHSISVCIPNFYGDKDVDKEEDEYYENYVNSGNSWASCTFDFDGNRKLISVSILGD